MMETVPLVGDSVSRRVLLLTAATVAANYVLSAH